MIALIGELRGRKPDCRFAEWRPGDQPWYISDTRAISRALGWQPRTAVPEGLRALNRWLDSRAWTPDTAAAPGPALQEVRA
jgi:CDP-paratose 2-epimerase